MSTPANTIVLIPRKQIVKSPTNPRTTFDKTKLEELAESIRRRGILQALIVREFPTSGIVKYQLIAGERRWLAAQIAGLETVPCTVQNLNDQEVVLVQQIENVQREDVSALDEARGYEQLRKLGLKLKDIASEVGKSDTHISAMLGILRCTPEVIKAVGEGRISSSHAGLLATVHKEKQDDYLDEVVGEHLSVKDLRQLIEEESYRRLTDAPFKQDDAALLPKVGMCTVCRKNTDVSPELRATIGKPHTCTDTVCYQAKLDAFIDRAVDKAKKDGDPLTLLSRNTSATHGGVLGWEAWKVVPLKNKKAARGIIVEGKDFGQIVRFTRIKPFTLGDTKWKKREEKRKARALTERRYRQAVFDELKRKAPKKLGRPELALVLRKVAPSSKIRGTVEQRILLGSIEEAVHVTEYYTPPGTGFFDLAKRAKVDLKRIRKQLNGKKSKRK